MFPSARSKRTVTESHYYRESAQHGFEEITDEAEKNKIDRYKKKKGFFPDGVTQETGYASFTLDGVDVPLIINPSLLKKTLVAGGTGSVVIERLPDAPKLPVSCLETVEHVVAMQNSVSDFSCEVSPEKNRVVYEISVRILKLIYEEAEEKELLRNTILKHDTKLKEEDIAIGCDIGKGLFFIEVSTQKGDIKSIIKGIVSLRRYFEIMDKEFQNIALNEGVCFVKKDASNPIHAMVNVVDTPSIKGFLDRDAGATSGWSPTYKDRAWTIKLFKRFKEIHQTRGHDETAFCAVGMHLKT